MPLGQKVTVSPKRQSLRKKGQLVTRTVDPAVPASCMCAFKSIIGARCEHHRRHLVGLARSLEILVHTVCVTLHLSDSVLLAWSVVEFLCSRVSCFSVFLMIASFSCRRFCATCFRQNMLRVTREHSAEEKTESEPRDRFAPAVILVQRSVVQGDRL